MRGIAGRAQWGNMSACLQAGCGGCVEYSHHSGTCVVMGLWSLDPCLSTFTQVAWTVLSTSFQHVFPCFPGYSVGTDCCGGVWHGRLTTPNTDGVRNGGLYVRPMCLTTTSAPCPVSGGMYHLCFAHSMVEVPFVKKSCPVLPGRCTLPVSSH
jgi:hypothetical protein